MAGKKTLGNPPIQDGEISSRSWGTWFTDIFGIVKKIENIQIPPVNSTDPGKAGTVLWDGNFMYYCVSDSTWVRVALITW